MSADPAQTGDIWDVIVVGAGNAALCAALSAAEQGAKVLVLEKATLEDRGGNSTFTAGGFRFCHDGVEDLRTDILDDMTDGEYASIGNLPPLSHDSFMEQLMRVTEHQADEELAEILIGRSRETMRWMRTHKIRFIPMFGRQSFKIEGKHHFYGGVNIEAVGGGWGLVDMLVSACDRMGITIRYETGLRELIQDRKGRVTGVRAFGPDGYEDIAGKAVVLACGGFESCPEMRVRYLGPGWELCRVRGTQHNTGDGINAAMRIGARPHGGWSSCHAVQWDISAPPYGDRVVLDNFQKHSYIIGVVVNMKGKRFIDEGADYRNHTYAKYGKEVMKQPGRAAVQIFDAKTHDNVRDEYRIKQVTKATANTIEELAEALDIDVAGLKAEIAAYNAACPAGAFGTTYNPSIFDGVGTKGLEVPKSNWALPIDTAPYHGYVVTCGITFTFGGLKINTDGQVLDLTEKPIPGLYAAGELVGGIFYENYPGGTGLLNGSVFGRLAGRNAGQLATSG
jgi:tricarballylate dehydrogenase